MGDGIENYLPRVRKQYENFPYPPVDRDDIVLPRPYSSHLLLINHHCFGGRKLFAGCRVLVAGGGTGDATLFFADQLQHVGGEVVHLDLSQHSIEIAKHRARALGLTNITWVQDSLLNLKAFSLGVFDIIQCSGVLHHLKDPVAGLCVLAEVLAEDGAMNLMVYGEYGRTGVYHIQDLMRLIAIDSDTDRDKLRLCEKMLKTLPESNYYQPTAGIFSADAITESGRYDLFLHSQDRAYTVPQLYDFCHQAGLKLLKFLPFSNVFESVYRPEMFVRGVLLDKVRRLSLQDQQAFAELCYGLHYKHEWYTAKQIVQPPSPEDIDFAILIGPRANRSLFEGIYKKILMHEVGDVVSVAIASENTIELSFVYTSHLPLIITSILEHHRSIRSMLLWIQSKIDPVNEALLLAEVVAFYNVMSKDDLLILCHDRVIQSHEQLCSNYQKHLNR